MNFSTWGFIREPELLTKMDQPHPHLRSESATTTLELDIHVPFDEPTYKLILEVSIDLLYPDKSYYCRLDYSSGAV